MANLPLIQPDWPAPDRVHAVMTTRHGGVSRGGYGSLNLATHVGDEPLAVAENRRRLIEALHLPAAPHWLEQNHSTTVVECSDPIQRCADASIARQAGVVCVVLTADCLPLLLCDRAGQVVAAVHAGWRGLLQGVVENTVQQMGVAPAELLVWLGAAIGPSAFEVGAEVRQPFIDRHPAATTAFTPSLRPNYWLADLYTLARLRLAEMGVHAVWGGSACTVHDPEQFFSYRRDGAVSGRMASLIWLDGG